MPKGVQLAHHLQQTSVLLKLLQVRGDFVLCCLFLVLDKTESLFKVENISVGKKRLVLFLLVLEFDSQ